MKAVLVWVAMCSTLILGSLLIRALCGGCGGVVIVLGLLAASVTLLVKICRG